MTCCLNWALGKTLLPMNPKPRFPLLLPILDLPKFNSQSKQGLVHTCA